MLGAESYKNGRRIFEYIGLAAHNFRAFHSTTNLENEVGTVCTPRGATRYKLNKRQQVHFVFAVKHDQPHPFRTPDS